MTHKGWIGVDLDGTLAHYDGWKGPEVIGDPVPRMLTRVKDWLAEGREVRIFTARAYPLGLIDVPEVELPLAPEHSLMTHRVMTAYTAVHAIRAWCLLHLGQYLTITCIKDYSMTELWDDRAVQVELNTGRPYSLPPLGEVTP